MVTPHLTRKDALRQIAAHARGRWDKITAYPGVPDAPSISDQEAADLYYGPYGPGSGYEGYSLRFVPFSAIAPCLAPPPAIADAHPAPGAR